MSDIDHLNADRLWLVACKFSRKMYDFAAAAQLDGEQHLLERVKAAALKLPSRIFQACEAADAGLKALHLHAAAESARELRHYLTVAARMGELRDADSSALKQLSDELLHVLCHRADNRNLAETA